jgi:O-antigen ligase
LVRSGVSSRTAYLLFSGQFIEHDSGRNEIWNSAFTLINQEPIIGWGIGAANKIIGTYPHQIFLDLWLSFGYLFGTIVAILLLIPFRKVFLNISATPEHLYLLQIFTSMSISLLFSSTLFTNYYFFIALGVALSVNANKYE